MKKSYKKRGGDGNIVTVDKTENKEINADPEEEKKSVLDTISGHAFDLKNKFAGLFSGGRKYKKKFSTKKRKTTKYRKSMKKRKTNKKKIVRK